MPRRMPSGGNGSAATRRTRLLRRLAWFVALWLAGVGTVGAVAALLRLWIG